MHIQSLKQIKNLMPEVVVERKLLGKLQEDLLRREIQIIYGPRQIGKSTLMYALMESSFSDKQDMFYFNLDQMEPSFDTAELFLADIRSRKRHSGRVLVFIDEIQRKRDIGLFLKYIYDRREAIKFVVTGSSSLNIKSIIHEPLTGRKFEYMLHPMGVAELFSHNKLDPSGLKLTTPAMKQILDEYLLYGGYPEVVLSVGAEDKLAKLKEIASSYIRRDLIEMFDIRNSTELERTAIYLGQNIASLLSKENVAKTTGISVHQVNNYLEALTKSFILDPVFPFYRNPAKELIHRPKLYFIDNGIRNVLLQKTANSLIASDLGILFEQSVLQILRQKGLEKIRFWRNYNQTEVDFIVETAQGLSAFEVKYSWEKNSLPASLNSFVSQYKKNILTARVITKDNYYHLL